MEEFINKDLKQKAEAWCLERPHHRYGEMTPIESECGKYVRGGKPLALHPSPFSLEAIEFGHQLALEGASEGFEEFYLKKWGTLPAPENAHWYTNQQDAWQARGLLAMKREGELLERIERLREAMEKLESEVGRFILTAGDGALSDATNQARAALIVDGCTALAADKGEA